MNEAQEMINITVFSAWNCDVGGQTPQQHWQQFISHALNNGFSVELIHRDSFKSLLYHPTETKFERIFNVYGSIDTGSDLVWLQCKPCNICYKQTSPIFNPSKSSSANVKLDSKGAFLTIYEGIECFAFFFPGGPIFGSLAQRNLLVGYDLEKSIVSFKPIILPNLLGRLIIKFYILFHISLRTNFASIDP
ncbi:eukaryotic aspartyl protease family protein, putative [Medicago truncatula]|uniref:Eukaryotic aspartyl protease family protein, putative n=1 Tax=Medicago truncatula TaxID=3880 RepID=G7IUT0_MEDTR|nr:eukaryotic aspartyl protease family protein, putative [Medicago truncatula]